MIPGPFIKFDDEVSVVAFLVNAEKFNIKEAMANEPRVSLASPLGMGSRIEAWRVTGRVIEVKEVRAQSEYALIGVPLSFEYVGTLLPKLSLKPGLLFRVGIPVPDAEKKLDAIAAGEDGYEGAPLKFKATRLQPMAEPCARVPVSLLRELRGQHGIPDMSREALVRCWTKDRDTRKTDG